VLALILTASPVAGLRPMRMTLQGINDAKHWRDRAAQMRVLSDVMKDQKLSE
jgi:hypothetical protein